MEVLVIHAKNLKERVTNIEEQLKKLDGKHTLILDGDVSELTDEVLDKYFVPGSVMHAAFGAASCSVKHMLAYKHVIDAHLEGALILEDDIVLHAGACAKLKQSISEYRNRFSGKPVMISYEDTSLRFVPRSQRRKGLMLYKAPYGRCRYAGAYFVSQEAAKAMVDYVEQHKMHMPIDHFHTVLSNNGIIDYYYCEPAIATQGSFTGLFGSSVGQRKVLEGVRWRLKYIYKRVLYWFR